jgi:hypothetical protein
MNPEEFRTTAFKTIVDKPIEVDRQVNDLIRDGWIFKSNQLLADGDMVVTLIKRELINTKAAERRFTPKAAPNTPVFPRGYSADGR